MGDKVLCDSIFTLQREITLYIREDTLQRKLDRYRVMDVATSQLANTLRAGSAGGRWEIITSASTPIQKRILGKKFVSTKCKLIEHNEGLVFL